MFGDHSSSTFSQKQYYWCWRCRGLVRLYRTVVDTVPRCEHCFGPVMAMPLHRLRYLSFLNYDNPTDEDLLRRAVIPPRQRRHDNAHHHHDRHRQSTYEQRHDRHHHDHSRRHRSRPTVRHQRMTREAALAIFGLDDLATPQQIKRAYRRLAREHHPDAHRSDHAKADAHQRMTRINQAYAKLCAGTL